MKIEIISISRCFKVNFQRYFKPKKEIINRIIIIYINFFFVFADEKLKRRNNVNETSQG